MMFNIGHVHDDDHAVDDDDSRQNIDHFRDRFKSIFFAGLRLGSTHWM